MTSNYSIIPNFFDTPTLNSIKKTLFSNEFPYYYQNTIVYGHQPNQLMDYCFGHRIFYLDEDISSFYDIIGKPFVDRIEMSKLLRVKVNCYPVQPTNFKHGVHVDNDSPHIVALWNANTNNGKTILYLGDRELEIPSEENELIIFDGSIKHQSVSQTDTKLRINININFTVEGM